MNIPTNSDIDALYARFNEQRESLSEQEAFFACVRSLFPEVDGAEDDTKTWVRYSPKLVEEICSKIAVGTPIRWILREKTMPSWNTMRRWLDKYPAFGEAYNRAMEHRADYLAHRMVELSKKCEEDPKNANGYKVAASILQWQAAMGNPKKYSEKMLLQHEDITPMDPSKVFTEMDRLCKQLGISTTLLIEEKKS